MPCSGPCLIPHWQSNSQYFKNVEQSSHLKAPATSVPFLCTLRLGQNGWHFADDIFTCISMNQNDILIEISLKFVATCSSCNKSLLVQVMDWRWTGDNPLPNNDDRFHLLTYAPLCLNEIKTRGLVLYKGAFMPVTGNRLISTMGFAILSIANPIVEIRRSYVRLISTMGLPILIRWHFYIESTPRCFFFLMVPGVFRLRAITVDETALIQQVLRRYRRF